MTIPTDELPDESQIDQFLGKYSPAIESELREARKRLCASFSRGYELIYDNYNALVFAISPTDVTADAFISVAGYPKWVTLFFINGATLNDPKRLLEGKGKQVRSIRLTSAVEINTRDVQALISQAVAPFEAVFLDAPPLTTVIKAVMAKQRPRRPSVASSRSTSPKRSVVR